ncbi:hypothetical protein DPMN_140945 [Dreissena polymorpha]|uniref:Uncharacterized protein n=1 Tax=Dreissena polymorpha TaxID=45954 RepID=A0A9D4JHU7_DREPO|nr:hypothetical protein DPMN_140945 [Dreissena polymorpha]
MCASEFLRCELYRDWFGTNTSPGVGLYDNYDISVQIDSILFYLQYLTYRELHQEPKQTEALMKLMKLIFTEIYKSTRFHIPCVAHGFFNTSLNMLGHCYELENMLELGWNTYKTSVQLLIEGNAAALHIARLLWRVDQRLQS